MSESFLIANEGSIRFISFISVFLLLAAWEVFAPRRSLTVGKSLRWFNNLSLMLINTLVLRYSLPVLAVGFSIYAQEQQWGLFVWLEWAAWVEVILAITLLDLAIYWQHRLFHTVPLFWRMHRMHHSDRDLDVTSAIRFHPLEMVISMLYKLCLIALLGPSVVAVILFEILLNALSLFTHTNGYLPVSLDKKLRWIFVTPDMHRIHHSKYYVNETNSNYGVLTSLWDRLFSSYSDDPKDGQTNFVIGIEGFSTLQRAQYLNGLLLTPFIEPEEETSTN